MVVFLIVLLVLWIGGAILIAQTGARRGYGFTGFLLVGLFFSPLTSGVLLALDRGPRRPPTADERLATLEKLHASGALSDDEYAAQRAGAGGGPAREYGPS
jgi:hypothetical protein